MQVGAIAKRDKRDKRNARDVRPRERKDTHMIALAWAQARNAVLAHAEREATVLVRGARTGAHDPCTDAHRVEMLMSAIEQVCQPSGTTPLADNTSQQLYAWATKAMLAYGHRAPEADAPDAPDATARPC
jgi:hypothetical protein